MGSSKVDFDKILSYLGSISEQMGLDSYVIGGFVRDFILGRPTKDIDVVVVGSGIGLAKAFSKSIGKGCSLSVFKNFGTAQVKIYKRNDLGISDTLEIEFVGARKESYRSDSRKPIVEDGTLEDDQNRRDFTINALAIKLKSDFCLKSATVIDPFGGLSDIEKKIIRTPLDPDVTYSDDPLRMMRAIRFASQLGFEIEKESFESIKRNAERIRIISAERIIDELNKIVLSPKPSIGFRLFDESGLMRIHFPELSRMKGVEVRGGKGHKDVFFHTLKVLDNLASKDSEVGDIKLYLRWAALLHDVGKPATKEWSETAGWTFKNHNYVGLKIIFPLFKRLKLPLDDKMKFVQKMVNLHMRPIVLSEDEVSDSAVRRLLFEAGDDIELLMMLCESDITSGNRDKVEKYLRNFKIVRDKLVIIEEKDRVRNFQPPISGEEIMKIFNIPPSKPVGEIKEAIKDAILDGIIPNEYDAAYKYMMDNFGGMINVSQ